VISGKAHLTRLISHMPTEEHMPPTAKRTKKRGRLLSFDWNCASKWINLSSARTKRTAVLSLFRKERNPFLPNTGLKPILIIPCSIFVKKFFVSKSQRTTLYFGSLAWISALVKGNWNTFKGISEHSLTLNWVIQHLWNYYWSISVRTITTLKFEWISE